MKKIFALALAAVMTAGMTTVAFADVKTTVELDNAVWFDADDNGSIDADEYYPLSTIASGDVEVPGGTSLYILLKNDGGDSNVTEKDTVKKLKVKADWVVGKTDEKPSIEYKKIAGGYYYTVEVKIPENDTNKKIDLNGTIAVYESSSDIKDEAIAKSEKLMVDFNVAYGYNVKSGFDGTFDAEYETKGQVVDFDDDAEEIDIEFGDDATFTVDVTGQGKLNLKFNRDYNKEFAAMYDYANIDFLTFEATPSFNKTGILYIYADEDDKFIYEVTADGAKAVKAEYDEDYGAYAIKTRTLKAYAISDVELDEKTVTEDKTDDESSKTETETGKPNPDTGR